MQEDLFQYLWKMKLFNTSNLKTTDNENIEIIQVGHQNHYSGPDFFNAKIKIGSTVWAGNVELHIKTSDWLLHHHQHDSAYQNIILHVVYENDMVLKNTNGEVIKTLILKDQISETVIQKYQNFKEHNTRIPCEKSIAQVPSTFINASLEKLIIDRLERKSRAIESLLAENNQHWEQSFYIHLASTFGFKVNQIPFELLARSTPLAVLAKHKNNIQQLEAILLGQAGFLNDTFTENYGVMLQNEYTFLKKKYALNEIAIHSWKLSRLRPSNFPMVRIAQFAALIHHSSHLFSKIIATESVDELLNLFKVCASSYWDTHYHLHSKSSKSSKNIGKSAIEILIINSIVPFVFVYGKQYGNTIKSDFSLDLLERLSAEKNNVIAVWESIGIKPNNALQTQALIELKNNHCNLKKCLQCSIGHYIIKKE